ncbi:hypothetical protein K474DRAFT_741015 [Panus rudis PR-1116 ss-1]|nr:hypothetical protein K474DRAFT_741015 [Panus rudis PR-1116 ss-1]
MAETNATAMLLQEINSHSAALEKLREEMTQHQQHIRHCRERLNFHSSYALRRLPYELISEIFQQYANWCWDVYQLTSNASHSLFPPYLWLRVSHVCRHWRAVVLSSPRLFTRILTITQEHVEAFIARSGKLLLDVQIRFNNLREPGDGQKVITAIISQSPRIRSFVVLSDIHVAIAYLNANTFAELQTLTYKCSNVGDWSRDSHLLRHVLCHAPPRLHSLNIECSSPDTWTTIRWPSTLRHLRFCLNGYYFHEINEDMVSNMIDALRWTPCLESLEISIGEPHPPFDVLDVFEVLEPIVLRRLQTFRMRCSYDWVMAMLDVLEFGPSVSIDIRCPEPVDVDIEFERIHNALKKLFHWRVGMPHTVAIYVNTSVCSHPHNIQTQTTSFNIWEGNVALSTLREMDVIKTPPRFRLAFVDVIEDQLPEILHSLAVLSAQACTITTFSLDVDLAFLDEAIIDQSCISQCLRILRDIRTLRVSGVVALYKSFPLLVRPDRLPLPNVTWIRLEAKPDEWASLADGTYDEPIKFEKFNNPHGNPTRIELPWPMMLFKRSTSDAQDNERLLMEGTQELVFDPHNTVEFFLQL